MTPRRQLTVAVVACAAAAGLALFAASRTWLVEVTVRPEPLPAVTTTRSGGSLVPSLPALGWVALAAAGALLATRGRARAALGLLIVLVGLAMPMVVLGGTPTAGAGGWRLLATMAGVVAAATGVVTIRWGRSWPALGSRYERPTAPGRTSGTRGGGPVGGGGGRADFWDALDRGEDPTRV